MGRYTDTQHDGKTKLYLLPDKLKVLYSYRIDFLFVSLLLILSILYFRDILENETLLLYAEVAHGDLIYALTIDEHFRHHLDNLPAHGAKLPLLSILYPLQIILGDLLAVKVFTILILFLAATLVYLGNKQLVSRFEGRRSYWLSASCFVGSLVTIYNPWTINEIHHHYWLILSLAASYLLIAVIDSYMRSKERNNINRLLLIAFSTSLVATQPQSAIIYVLPMLAIYLIVNIIFHRPKILSKTAAKKVSILVIITIACNLFWLVPVIQGLTTGRLLQDVVSYGTVQENVDALSRRATIDNVLQGTSFWIWGDGSDRTPDQSIKINNIDIWEILARIVPLFFIVFFFIIRRPIGKENIYIVVFFIALVILSVILATGSYYNDIYKRFFLDFPFGEAIRDPHKFVGLYFVAVNFFASASIYRMENKRLGKNTVIFLSMVGLILSWGWVGLTGDLNGHLTRALLPYPHDLSEVSEYLHREYETSSDAKGNIFWYPAAEGAIRLQYSSVPELSTESMPDLKLPRFQLDYINYLINKSDTSVIPLLEYLGVQYLVIREDYVYNDNNNTSPESLQEVQTRVQNLRTILNKNMVFESGRFEVYKLNTNSLVSVSHAISTGTDDLSKVTKVTGESEYLNNIQLGPFVEDSLIVSDLLPPESSGGAITLVDPASEHYLPERYWSAGAINGGWMNTIMPYLDRYGIKTWQFDYNNGFIFTSGEKYSPSRFTLENAKILTALDFNSPNEVLQWESSDPKVQSLELENNTMRVVLNSSSSGWKTIKSPAFDVSTDRVYIIKLGVQYSNVENAHLRLTEYDKNGNIIDSAIVRSIGTNTSSWKDISFSYRPSNKEVTSIGLSIWHGNLTKKPLPNILWIDNVRIYDVLDQVQENSISVPFKVNNNNNYKVFVRYLESFQGGLVNAMLEGNLIQMSTLSDDPKFVWKDVGEYTLNQGSHTMTFINERGFNAVNAILLIQKDQFEEIKGRIEDWLNRNSSTSIYIFEAESDMNINDKTIADGIPSDSDNVVLENSTAWKHFDVRKEGDYRIWIKGSGKFIVVVNDHKEIVNATMDRPTLSEPFRLNEGDSRLEVTPLQEPGKSPTNDYQIAPLVYDTTNSSGSNVTSLIDSIWLVTDSNHLHELFDDNNNNNDSQNQTQLTTATISNKGWSSQKYEIKLNNSTKPLMISLAEPFNPDLRAAIYTKDGLSKTENLIPLFYSLKSGIYIDSLATDAKVVIYDAGTSLQWLVVSSFLSVASYVLLILSANVKLKNGFKGLVCNLNRLVRERISQNKNK